MTDKLKNWSRLELKLNFAFGLLTVAMMAIAWISFSQLQRSELTLAQYENEIADELLAREVVNYANINARLTTQIFTTEDRREIDSLLSRRADTTTRISQLLSQIEQSIEGPEEAELVNRIKERRDTYLLSHEAALHLLLQHADVPSARTAIVAQVMPGLTRFHEALNNYIYFQQQRVAQLKASNNAAVGKSRLQTFSLMAVVIVIVVVITASLALSTRRHIKQREHAERALEGAYGRLEVTVRERTSELLASNNDLLESERRYRLLFESNPQPMWVFDDQTLRFLTVNDAAVIQYGYSRREFLQMTLRDIHPVEDLPALDSTKAKSVNGFGTYDEQTRWRHRRKDGSLIDVEITWHTLKFKDRPAKLVLARDITERRRAEEALRASERRRQLIAEIIQGVINTRDLNELLHLVHQSIAKYLYAENCFVALYDEATELLHYAFWVDKFDPRPEPRPVGIGFSGYVFKTGKPMLVSPQLTAEMSDRGEVQKSGSSSASWMGVPLRTPDRTIGVLVVQHYEEEGVYDERDLEFLTSVGSQLALAIERKRAEQALQESEERYHRLVELSPEAIVIHQDGRFVFVNSATVRLAGARDASDLIGKSIFDIVAPEYEDMLRERVANMYDGVVLR